MQTKIPVFLFFRGVCLKPVCKFSLKFSYSSTVFGDLISTNWFHLNESSPHPMSHFYSIPRKQISNREKVIFYFRSGYRSRIWKYIEKHFRFDLLYCRLLTSNILLAVYELYWFFQGLKSNFEGFYFKWLRFYRNK